MSDFTCQRCGNTLGDVRLVEHGTDDVALCKLCFKGIGRSAPRGGR